MQITLTDAKQSCLRLIFLTVCYSIYGRCRDTKIECSECTAEIAQLGERQTEDLKVPGSIPGLGIFKNRQNRTQVEYDETIAYMVHITTLQCFPEFSWILQKWRIRVSIPVPLECKSSALPLELIPRAKLVFRKPCNGLNISIFCGFHWWWNIFADEHFCRFYFSRIRTHFSS